MGLAPSLLPGRVGVGSNDFEGDWGPLPEAAGRETGFILKALEAGSISGLLLVGADPARDVPDGSLARRALEAADFVVAIDTFLTDSSRLADVVLPAEGFAEKEGSVTNLEGRVQKVNRVVPGPGQSRPDWSILDDLSTFMGKPLNLTSAESIAKEIATVAPAYQGVTWDLLEGEGRDGVVVPLPEARQPLNFIPADAPGKSAAGEIVLHYARTLFDDGVMLRYSPSLAPLAPGAAAHLHPDDAKLMTVREGDEVEVETESGSARLSVRLDHSLGHGVVYIPFNQPGVASLGSDPRVTVKKVPR
jgi:predicted molibdopterin-dependent oxidoreductase YjgC